MLVSFTEEVHERGNRELAGYKFKKKSLSPVEKTERKNTSSFKKISSIQPRTLKTMKEARGYIVADYQDYLEKNWIQELAQAYEVKVNNKVFKKLIQK